MSAQMWFQTPVLVGAGLALLVAVGLLFRALWVLGRPARQSWRTRGSQATVTIEFALLLPILLFVILALAQTTLLMGGFLYVHHAAFAAARSAVVQIPADYAGEPGNIYGGEGYAKHDAILRAAAYGLVPVSGRASAGSSVLPADEVVAAMGQFFASYGLSTPAWVENLLAERIAYAAENTEVQVGLAVVLGDGTVDVNWDVSEFDPKDAIVVRVNHKLNLSIPYVNRIVATGLQPNGYGRYLDTDAQYTMTNAGVLPDLPPQPELPRIP